MRAYSEQWQYIGLVHNPKTTVRMQIIFNALYKDGVSSKHWNLKENNV